MTEIKNKFASTFMNQFNTIARNQNSGKDEKNFVSGGQHINKPQNETSIFQKTKQGARTKQKKLVDMEGFVTHNLSNGKFRLKLDNGVEVIGHLSGKIRQNRIKIVVGDKVTVELSPYDLTKGRITYRHR